MTEDIPLSPEQVHLVETHLDLSHKIALSFWRKNPEIMEKGEVVSTAYLGLISAAVNFDPDWRPPNDPAYDPFLAFGAFAKRRITGAILDWQRKQDHVPRRQRAAYKNLQSHGHGSGRSPEELADLTGLPADKIRTITQAVESASVPFDDRSEESPGGGASVEDSVLVLSIQSAVADTITGFHPVQRSVVVLRYFMGYDFPAIAGELGVSVMTARTLHSEAMLLIHDVMREAAHS